MHPQQLLQAPVVDTLPQIGVGSSARVFRHGRYAVKVAHPDRRSRRRLADEIEVFGALADGALPTPRYYCADKTRGVLVRAWMPGLSLSEQIALDSSLVDEVLLDELLDLAARVEQCSAELGRVLDLCPANLYAFRPGGRWVLVDLGERLDAPRYLHLSRASLRRALLDDASWRQRHLHRPGQLYRFFMPPSGRFAVEVDVGPTANARLLWVNRPLLKRLQLEWSDRRLLQMGSLTTFCFKPDRQLLATRYQDSPGIGEGQAQGDGRVLMLGCVDGGPFGQRELSLKGCGPTPLAWQGQAYHSDGLVSFNRSLWEAAISDELRRLGFDSPEVLALVDNGARTVDNTEQKWPSATALRVSHSHLRLGHLHRWFADPEMLRHMIDRVGRSYWGPGFNAQRQRDMGKLLHLFVHNLGYNCGKSDALNVHCFNPTLGNLRVDGHFIDFSTVRLQAHCMPDYRYLDGKRRVREHRAALRNHVPRLLALLAQAGLISAHRQRVLQRRLLELFNHRDALGYLEGLARFFNVDSLAPPASLARIFVAETRRLRALRATETLDYPFWKQRHPAPLFDLENRLPEFVAVWSQGRRDAWRELQSSYVGQIDDFSAHVARSWQELLEQAVPASLRKNLHPRRWSKILRPQLENNHLAELCYLRSTPAHFAAWRRAIGS